MKQVPDSKKISMHSKMVDILSKVMLDMMKEAQVEEVDISKTIHYVKPGKKPTLAQIQKNKIKTCAKISPAV